MAHHLQSAGAISLTDMPVPGLLESQLALFTTENIHLATVRAFDAAKAAQGLAREEGKQVVAADFGGDKGTSRLFTVRDGTLTTTDGFSEDIQGDNGIGYLAAIRRSTAFAETHQLPFGLSWGGPIDGSKLLFHPKATRFYDDVQDATGGDLAQISPNITAVLNDGPAGLVSGAVEAYRQYKAQTVLFIINGGGIGLGVLKEGTIFATEAGHVEGCEDLNIYEQTEPCGVFGATFVCMERLGANKAGIEAQWQARTGSYMRAKDIEDEYLAGNVFAAELYDHSALVVAHVIQGAANTMGIDLTGKDTVVVGHGGAFKFPRYGERILQILEQHNRHDIQFIMTKDYTGPSSNACQGGAAIAALTASLS